MILFFVVPHPEILEAPLLFLVHFQATVLHDGSVSASLRGVSWWRHCDQSSWEALCALSWWKASAGMLKATAPEVNCNILYFPYNWWTRRICGGQKMSKKPGFKSRAGIRLIQMTDLSSDLQPPCPRLVVPLLLSEIPFLMSYGLSKSPILKPLLRFSALRLGSWSLAWQDSASAKGVAHQQQRFVPSQKAHSTF